MTEIENAIDERLDELDKFIDKKISEKISRLITRLAAKIDKLAMQSSVNRISNAEAHKRILEDLDYNMILIRRECNDRK